MGKQKGTNQIPASEYAQSKLNFIKSPWMKSDGIPFGIYQTPKDYNPTTGAFQGNITHYEKYNIQKPDMRYNEAELARLQPFMEKLSNSAKQSWAKFSGMFLASMGAWDMTVMREKFFPTVYEIDKNNAELSTSLARATAYTLLEKDMTNAINETADSIMQRAAEKYPIFRYSQGFDLSDPSFWLQTIPEIAGVLGIAAESAAEIFLAGLLIPETAGASAAVEVLSLAEKTPLIMKLVENIRMGYVAMKEYKLGEAAMKMAAPIAVLNRIKESQMEALQTYRDIYRELDGMNVPEFVHNAAADGAWKTFGLNMILLPIEVMQEELAAGVLKLAPGMFGAIASTFVSQSMEGIEEMLQNHFSNEGLRVGLAHQHIIDHRRYIDRFFGDVFSDEGLTSGFAGFIGGMGSHLLHKAAYSAVNKMRDIKLQRKLNAAKDSFAGYIDSGINAIKAGEEDPMNVLNHLLAQSGHAVAVDIDLENIGGKRSMWGRYEKHIQSLINNGELDEPSRDMLKRLLDEAQEIRSNMLKNINDGKSIDGNSARILALSQYNLKWLESEKNKTEQEIAAVSAELKRLESLKESGQDVDDALRENSMKLTALSAEINGIGKKIKERKDSIKWLSSEKFHELWKKHRLLTDGILSHVNARNIKYFKEEFSEAFSKKFYEKLASMSDKEIEDAIERLKKLGEKIDGDLSTKDGKKEQKGEQPAKTEEKKEGEGDKKNEPKKPKTVEEIAEDFADKVSEGKDDTDIRKDIFDLNKKVKKATGDQSNSKKAADVAKKKMVDNGISEEKANQISDAIVADAMLSDESSLSEAISNIDNPPAEGHEVSSEAPPSQKISYDGVEAIEDAEQFDKDESEEKQTQQEETKHAVESAEKPSETRKDKSSIEAPKGGKSAQKASDGEIEPYMRLMSYAISNSRLNRQVNNNTKQRKLADSIYNAVSLLYMAMRHSWESDGSKWNKLAFQNLFMSTFNNQVSTILERRLGTVYAALSDAFDELEREYADDMLSLEAIGSGENANIQMPTILAAKFAIAASANDTIKTFDGAKELFDTIRSIVKITMLDNAASDTAMDILLRSKIFGSKQYGKLIDKLLVEIAYDENKEDSWPDSTDIEKDNKEDLQDGEKELDSAPPIHNDTPGEIDAMDDGFQKKSVANATIGYRAEDNKFWLNYNNVQIGRLFDVSVNDDDSVVMIDWIAFIADYPDGDGDPYHSMYETTWGEFKKKYGIKKGSNEYTANVPIAIIHDGDIVGYVHVQSWDNGFTHGLYGAKDDDQRRSIIERIEASRLKNIELRRLILSGEIDKVKISAVTVGGRSSSSDTISLGKEDVILGTSLKSGSFGVTKEGKIVAISDNNVQRRFKLGDSPYLTLIVPKFKDETGEIVYGAYHVHNIKIGNIEPLYEAIYAAIQSLARISAGRSVHTEKDLYVSDSVEKITGKNTLREAIVSMLQGVSGVVHINLPQPEIPLDPPMHPSRIEIPGIIAKKGLSAVLYDNFGRFHFVEGGKIVYSTREYTEKEQTKEELDNGLQAVARVLNDLNVRFNVASARSDENVVLAKVLGDNISFSKAKYTSFIRGIYKTDIAVYETKSGKHWGGQPLISIEPATEEQSEDAITIDSGIDTIRIEEPSRDIPEIEVPEESTSLSTKEAAENTAKYINGLIAKVRDSDILIAEHDIDTSGDYYSIETEYGVIQLPTYMFESPSDVVDFIRSNMFVESYSEDGEYKLRVYDPGDMKNAIRKRSEYAGSINIEASLGARHEDIPLSVDEAISIAKDVLPNSGNLLDTIQGIVGDIDIHISHMHKPGMFYHYHGKKGIYISSVFFNVSSGKARVKRVSIAKEVLAKTIIHELIHAALHDLLSTDYSKMSKEARSVARRIRKLSDIVIHSEYKNETRDRRYDLISSPDEVLAYYLAGIYTDRISTALEGYVPSADNPESLNSIIGVFNAGADELDPVKIVHDALNVLSSGDNPLNRPIEPQYYGVSVESNRNAFLMHNTGSRHDISAMQRSIGNFQREDPNRSYIKYIMHAAYMLHASGEAQIDPMLKSVLERAFSQSALKGKSKSISRIMQSIMAIYGHDYRFIAKNIERIIRVANGKNIDETEGPIVINDEYIELAKLFDDSIGDIPKENTIRQQTSRTKLDEFITDTSKWSNFHREMWKGILPFLNKSNISVTSGSDNAFDPASKNIILEEDIYEDIASGSPGATSLAIFMKLVINSATYAGIERIYGRDIDSLTDSEKTALRALNGLMDALSDSLGEEERKKIEFARKDPNHFIGMMGSADFFNLVMNAYASATERTGRNIIQRFADWIRSLFGLDRKLSPYQMYAANKIFSTIRHIAYISSGIQPDSSKLMSRDFIYAKNIVYNEITREENRSTLRAITFRFGEGDLATIGGDEGGPVDEQRPREEDIQARRNAIVGWSMLPYRVSSIYVLSDYEKQEDLYRIIGSKISAFYDIAGKEDPNIEISGLISYYKHMESLGMLISSRIPLRDRLVMYGDIAYRANSNNIFKFYFELVNETIDRIGEDDVLYAYKESEFLKKGLEQIGNNDTHRRLFISFYVAIRHLVDYDHDGKWGSALEQLEADTQLSRAIASVGIVPIVHESLKNIDGYMDENDDRSKTFRLLRAQNILGAIYQNDLTSDLFSNMSADDIAELASYDRPIPVVPLLDIATGFAVGTIKAEKPPSPGAAIIGAIDLMKDNIVSEETRAFARELGLENIKIEIWDTSERYYGLFDGGILESGFGKIVLNARHLKGLGSKPTRAQKKKINKVIRHELIHAATNRLFRTPTDKLSDSEREFVSLMRRVSAKVTKYLYYEQDDLVAGIIRNHSDEIVASSIDGVFESGIYSTIIRSIMGGVLTFDSEEMSLEKAISLTREIIAKDIGTDERKLIRKVVLESFGSRTSLLGTRLSMSHGDVFIEHARSKESINSSIKIFGLDLPGKKGLYMVGLDSATGPKMIMPAMYHTEGGLHFSDSANKIAAIYAIKHGYTGIGGLLAGVNLSDGQIERAALLYDKIKTIYGHSLIEAGLHIDNMIAIHSGGETPVIPMPVLFDRDEYYELASLISGEKINRDSFKNVYEKYRKGREIKEYPLEHVLNNAAELASKLDKGVFDAIRIAMDGIPEDVKVVIGDISSYHADTRTIVLSPIVYDAIMNPDGLDSSESRRALAIFAEELMHAATVYALDAYPLITFDLDKIRDGIIDALGKPSDVAINSLFPNIEEMIGKLADPDIFDMITGEIFSNPLLSESVVEILSSYSGRDINNVDDVRDALFDVLKLTSRNNAIAVKAIGSINKIYYNEAPGQDDFSELYMSDEEKKALEELKNKAEQEKAARISARIMENDDLGIYESDQSTDRLSLSPHYRESKILTGSIIRMALTELMARYMNKKIDEDLSEINNIADTMRPMIIKAMLAKEKSGDKRRAAHLMWAADNIKRILKSNIDYFKTYIYNNDSSEGLFGVSDSIQDNPTDSMTRALRARFMALPLYTVDEKGGLVKATDEYGLIKHPDPNFYIGKLYDIIHYTNQLFSKPQDLVNIILNIRSAGGSFKEEHVRPIFSIVEQIVKENDRNGLGYALIHALSLNRSTFRRLYVERKRGEFGKVKMTFTDVYNADNESFLYIKYKTMWDAFLSEEEMRSASQAAADEISAAINRMEKYSKKGIDTAITHLKNALSMIGVHISDRGVLLDILTKRMRGKAPLESGGYLHGLRKALRMVADGEEASIYNINYGIFAMRRIAGIVGMASSALDMSTTDGDKKIYRYGRMSMANIILGSLVNIHRKDGRITPLSGNIVAVRHIKDGIYSKYIIPFAMRSRFAPYVHIDSLPSTIISGIRRVDGDRLSSADDLTMLGLAMYNAAPKYVDMVDPMSNTYGMSGILDPKVIDGVSVRTIMFAPVDAGTTHRTIDLPLPDVKDSRFGKKSIKLDNGKSIEYYMPDMDTLRMYAKLIAGPEIERMISANKNPRRKFPYFFAQLTKANKKHVLEAIRSHESVENVFSDDSIMDEIIGALIEAIESDVVHIMQNIIHDESGGKVVDYKDIDVTRFVMNNMLGSSQIIYMFAGDPYHYGKGEISDYSEESVNRFIFNIRQNIHKRLKMIRTPMNRMAGSDNMKIVNLFLEDHHVIVKSLWNKLVLISGNKLTEWSKLEAAGRTTREDLIAELEKAGMERYVPYINENNTDSFEMITAAGALKYIERHGKVTGKNYRRLKEIGKKVFSGKALSAQDADFLFMAIQNVTSSFKPVYAGLAWNGSTREAEPVYIKSSVMPLFKMETTGFEIDKLREQMEEMERLFNGKSGYEGYSVFVKATYRSAVKVGPNVEYHKAWTEDGRFIPIDINRVIDRVTGKTSVGPAYVLNAGFWGDQVKNPNREDRETITNISQRTKTLVTKAVVDAPAIFDVSDVSEHIDHVLANALPVNTKEKLNGRDIHALRRELLKRIVEHSVMREMKKMGVSSFEELATSPRRLKVIIRAALMQFGAPIPAEVISEIYNQVKIEIDGVKRTTTKVPMQTLPYMNTVGQRLLAIITKSVLSYKIPGMRGPVVPQAGWKLVGPTDKVVMLSDKDSMGVEDIMIPARIFDSKGEWIDIHSDKYSYVDESGVRRLRDDMMSERMKTVDSSRLPFSFRASMSMGKIFAFLPKEAGTKVIAGPGMFTNKGNDADYDEESVTWGYYYIDKEGKIINLLDDKVYQSMNEMPFELIEMLYKRLGNKIPLRMVLAAGEYSMVGSGKKASFSNGLRAALKDFRENKGPLATIRGISEADIVGSWRRALKSYREFSADQIMNEYRFELATNALLEVERKIYTAEDEKIQNENFSPISFARYYNYTREPKSPLSIVSPTSTNTYQYSNNIAGHGISITSLAMQVVGAAANTDLYVNNLFVIDDGGSEVLDNVDYEIKVGDNLLTTKMQPSADLLSAYQNIFLDNEGSGLVGLLGIENEAQIYMLVFAAMRGYGMYEVNGQERDAALDLIVSDRGLEISRSLMDRSSTIEDTTNLLISLFPNGDEYMQSMKDGELAEFNGDMDSYGAFAILAEMIRNYSQTRDVIRSISMRSVPADITIAHDWIRQKVISGGEKGKWFNQLMEEGNQLSRVGHVVNTLKEFIPALTAEMSLYETFMFKDIMEDLGIPRYNLKTLEKFMSHQLRALASVGNSLIDISNMLRIDDDTRMSLATYMKEHILKTEIGRLPLIRELIPRKTSEFTTDIDFIGVISDSMLELERRDWFASLMEMRHIKLPPFNGMNMNVYTLAKLLAMYSMLDVGGVRSFARYIPVSLIEKTGNSKLLHGLINIMNSPATDADPRYTALKGMLTKGMVMMHYQKIGKRLSKKKFGDLFRRDGDDYVPREKIDGVVYYKRKGYAIVYYSGVSDKAIRVEDWYLRTSAQDADQYLPEDMIDRPVGDLPIVKAIGEYAKDTISEQNLKIVTLDDEMFSDIPEIVKKVVGDVKIGIGGRSYSYNPHDHSITVPSKFSYDKLMSELIHAATVGIFERYTTGVQSNIARLYKKIKSGKDLTVEDFLPKAHIDKMPASVREVAHMYELYVEHMLSKHRKQINRMIVKIYENGMSGKMARRYSKYYPLVSIMEFVSEVFSNERMRNQMRNIRFNPKETWLERFIRYIKKIWKDFTMRFVEKDDGEFYRETIMRIVKMIDDYGGIKPSVIKETMFTADDIPSDMMDDANNDDALGDVDDYVDMGVYTEDTLYDIDDMPGYVEYDFSDIDPIGFSPDIDYVDSDFSDFVASDILDIEDMFSGVNASDSGLVRIRSLADMITHHVRTELVSTREKKKHASGDDVQTLIEREKMLIGVLADIEKNMDAFKGASGPNRADIFDRVLTYYESFAESLLNTGDARDITIAGSIISMLSSVDDIRMDKVTGKINHPLLPDRQIYNSSGKLLLSEKMVSVLNKHGVKGRELHNEYNKKVGNIIYRLARGTGIGKGLDDDSLDKALKDPHGNITWFDMMAMDITAGVFSHNGIVPAIMKAAIEHSYGSRKHITNETIEKIDSIEKRLVEYLRRIGRNDLTSSFAGKKTIKWEKLFVTRELSPRLVTPHTGIWYRSVSSILSSFRGKKFNQKDLLEQARGTFDVISALSTSENEALLQYVDVAGSMVSGMEGITKDAVLAAAKNARERAEILIGSGELKKLEEEAKKKSELFLEERKALWNALMIREKEINPDSEVLTDERLSEFMKFEIENNPAYKHYVIASDINTILRHSNGEKLRLFSSRKFFEPVPIKESQIDERFKQIRSDSVIYEAYSEIMDIWKQFYSLMPEHSRAFISNGELIKMEKSIYDALLEADGIMQRLFVLMSESYRKMVSRIREVLTFTGDYKTRILYIDENGNKTYSIQPRFFGYRDRDYNVLKAAAKLEIKKRLEEAGFNVRINKLSGVSGKALDVIKQYFADNGINYDDYTGDKYRKFNSALRDLVVSRSSRDYSVDLPKLLKAMTVSANDYAARTASMPIIDMLKRYYYELGEYVVRANGEVLRDKDGNPVLKKTSERRIRQMENWYRNVVLGDYSDEDIALVFNGDRSERAGTIRRRISNKIKSIMKVGISKSSPDKDIIDAYIKAIKESESNEEKAEDLISKFKYSVNIDDNPVTFSGMVNLLMHWIRIKGIGWSVRSAVRNFIEGQTSNYITAKMLGINESYLNIVTPQDIIKGAAIRSVRGEKHMDESVWIALKVIDDFDIFENVLNELQKVSMEKKREKIKNALSPFFMTTMVEYANQTPLMVAQMKSFMIKDEDSGESVSAWDAIERREENGAFAIRVKDEYRDFAGGKLVQIFERQHGREYDKLRQVLLETIKYGHGDYEARSAMLVKNTSLAPLVLFKTFYGRILATYLSTRQYNGLLGKEFRGRLRTMTGLQGALVGASLFMHIGAVPALLAGGILGYISHARVKGGKVFGGEFGIDTDMGVMEELVTNIKLSAINIARLLTNLLPYGKRIREKTLSRDKYIKKIFDSIDDEVNASGYIANIQMMSMMLLTFGIQVLAASLIRDICDGDDGECPKLRSIYMTAFKHSDNIQQFVSPNGIYDAITTSALFSEVDKISQFMNDSYAMLGDGLVMKDKVIKDITDIILPYGFRSTNPRMKGSAASFAATGEMIQRAKIMKLRKIAFKKLVDRGLPPKEASKILRKLGFSVPKNIKDEKALRKIADGLERVVEKL